MGFSLAPDVAISLMDMQGYRNSLHLEGRKHVIVFLFLPLPWESSAQVSDGDPENLLADFLKAFISQSTKKPVNSFLLTDTCS